MGPGTESETYRGAADQNWFSLVILIVGLPVYKEFPCPKIFPLHNFQKLDCLCILAHTFGIRLLLLMVYTLQCSEGFWIYYNILHVHQDFPSPRLLH